MMRACSPLALALRTLRGARNLSARPASPSRPSWGPPPVRATTEPLETVDFSPQVANSVSLIGSAIRVEHKAFESGNKKTTIGLAVRNFALPAPGSTEPNNFVLNVECWDSPENALASRVYEHVAEKSRVMVHGKLVEESWTDKNSGELRKRLCMKADKVALMTANPAWAGEQGGAQARPEQARPDSKPRTAASSAGAASAAASARPAASKDEMWTDLLYHPENWYDERQNTAGNRRPDFKNRTDGSALWLDARDKPSWVADYMGERGEVPPRAWTPPKDDSAGQTGKEEAPF